MKITIETKFDIGDVVYVAHHYYDWYAEHKLYIVRDIVISVRQSIPYIQYDVELDGLVSTVSERVVFKTYEECAEWCAKNNWNFNS